MFLFNYRGYLEVLATDSVAKRELVAARLSRGWCVGDRAFKIEMKAAAAEKGAEWERYGGLEPEEVRRERAEAWEELLQAMARRAKIDLEKLPAPKSHPHKALLAAAMKAGSSVTNGWLAQRLAMGPPASASQFARRWLLEPERRAQAELLSRVKT